VGGEALFVGGCQVWQEGARVSKSSRGQIPMNRGVFWATLCPGGIVGWSMGAACSRVLKLTCYGRGHSAGDRPRCSSCTHAHPRLFSATPL
jgi:hypothetical protein